MGKGNRPDNLIFPLIDDCTFFLYITPTSTVEILKTSFSPYTISFLSTFY